MVLVLTSPNDFKPNLPIIKINPEPWNIVIKIMRIDNEFCIKISDNIAKNISDENTILKVKKELGYVDNEVA